MHFRYRRMSARLPKGNKLFWIALIVGSWIVFMYNYTDPIPNLRGTNEKVEEKSRYVKDGKITNQPRATSILSYFNQVIPRAERSSSVRIMTWNLQSYMGSKKQVKRINAAAKVISQELLDVVLLQETYAIASKTMCESLKEDFDCIVGQMGLISLHRKSRFTLESSENVTLDSSGHSSVLVIKLSVSGQGDTKVAVMNFHSPFSRSHKPRVEQLKQGFEISNKTSENYNFIIGGDTNVEDGEDSCVLPKDFKDIWKVLGSNEKTKYTWDSTENQNGKLETYKPADQQPKERYDRIYLRPSKRRELQLQPSDLIVTGKEKVEDPDLYVSDHWALVATFKLAK